METRAALKDIPDGPKTTLRSSVDTRSSFRTVPQFVEIRLAVIDPLRISLASG
jgi:hypothetical protein